MPTIRFGATLVWVQEHNPDKTTSARKPGRQERRVMAGMYSQKLLHLAEFL
jgi:hypothetical protein